MSSDIPAWELPPYYFLVAKDTFSQSVADASAILSRSDGCSVHLVETKDNGWRRTRHFHEGNHILIKPLGKKARIASQQEIDECIALTASLEVDDG